MSHSTATSTEKSLIEAFSDKPIAIILPIHLQLAGDYATAAALAQVLYWHKTMKGTFYKKDTGVDKDGIDRSFSTELMLTITQWKTVKEKLRKLPFLTLVTKGVPPVTHYSVDYEKLAVVIAEFQPKKSKKYNKTSFKPANTANSRDLPLIKQRDLPLIKQRDLPLIKQRDLPPYNTENTTEVTSTTTTTTSEPIPNTETKNLTDDVVVVMKEIFKTESDQKAVTKMLLGIQSQHMDVLNALKYGKQKKDIPNPVGYLATLCARVKNDTFTVPHPPKPAQAQETAAERLKREEIANKREQERHQAARRTGDADLAAKLAMVKGAFA